MKVLIGYDGSESAQAAINELKTIGLSAETEILIATAGDFWMPPADITAQPAAVLASRRVASTMAHLHNQTVNALEQAEEMLSAAAAEIESDFPDWHVQTEYLRGDAASALIQKAAEWEADLIIVGSQNRSAVGRFFLGSVSYKVVTEAGCSVRVARPTMTSDTNAPRRAVAGVDNSQSVHRIIETIARRLWINDSVITLVTATDGFDTNSPEPVKRVIAAQELQRSAKAMLASLGLKVLTVIKEGDAKNLLLTEAEKLHADCIFVSSRNLQGIFSRFFSGNVSTGVVTDAPCSVEVVR